MTKQNTERVPDETVEQADVAAEIVRVRADKDFTDRARTLIDRDQELLDRLAR